MTNSRLTDFGESPVLISVQPAPVRGHHGAHLFVGPTFAVTMAATYHDEGTSEDVKSDLDRTTDVGIWLIGGGAQPRG